MRAALATANLTPAAPPGRTPTRGASVIPYLILTATLAGSAGWCAGHRTARIRHIPIGATAAQDAAAIEAAQAAFLAHNRRRFNDLVADLDLPDDHDPRSAA